MEQSEINTNVPESEPLAETQTEETKEEVAQEEEVPQEEREPIKTVNTFWERLDEVLTNLEETPHQLHTRDVFKSALNQPKQIFCCSTQDINRGINGILQGFQESKLVQSRSFFDSFRVSFTDRSLLNVKSIQLYSASIPQAQTNITNSEIIFWFYKIPTLLSSTVGAWTLLTVYTVSQVVTFNGRYYGCYKTIPPGVNPNPSIDTAHWYDAGTTGTTPNWLVLAPSVRSNYLVYFFLVDSYTPPETYDPADLNLIGWNKTFTDYQDLLTEVNRAASTTVFEEDGENLITFTFDTRFNKFKVDRVSGGTNYFFLPPFSDTVYQAANVNFPLSLNMRLGFTQQLDIPDVLSSNPWTNNYIFVTFSDNVIGLANDRGNTYRTAESYPNLNYTNRVNVFADVVRSSSFDTFTGGELLASVPMNAGNLGVVLYQAVYPNKLVNVPPEIYDIFFYFETDNKIPYLFPKSATISLELALEYF